MGESIGAVIALTSAADVPERIRGVYALNPYDYETRYADGLRRGNLFANLIIGCLHVPVFGALAAAIATRWIIGNVMKGYAGPRKLRGDLITLFHKTGSRPHFHYAERRVLAEWRSWSKRGGARLRCEGACHTHLWRQGLVTDSGAQPRMFTLANVGYFSAGENPREIARIVLTA